MSDIDNTATELEPFATVDDFLGLTGKTLTSEEMERVRKILPAVSDIIRTEGLAAGVDVDAKTEASAVYANVVKTITVDVTARVLRQSQDGEPMSQESQAGFGYSWSGSYAIPGGGIAMSLMNNEKKILGFKRQKIAGVNLWPRSKA